MSAPPRSIRVMPAQSRCSAISNGIKSFALRCVIIPKLPFSSPTDPLSCERNLREDRAWARYSLPEAVLEVKQAAGRLIRSSTDCGVLILADPRLVTKGYGKKFLTSLPTSSYQRIESAQIGHYLQLWRARHERRR